MGCCFSSEVEKEPLITEQSPAKEMSSTYVPPPITPSNKPLVVASNNTTSPAVAGSPTSTTSASAHAAAMQAKAASLIDNLEKDIRSKWEKSMHTLPVASDFPRLAKLTKIFGVDGELEVPTPDQPSIERIIYGILLSLALQLDDQQTHDITRDNYWTYLRDNIEGEIRREFDSFLKNCMDEHSKVANVLKTINQGVIAPAVISLKLALPTLPFKDARNSWRIEVLVAQDTVTVVHIRREQSFNTPPEKTFEFVWECRIVFNKDVTTMDEVKIRIIELAFHEKVPPDHNAHIKHEMRRFIADDCVFTTLSA